jgi:hypothetical protein
MPYYMYVSLQDDDKIVVFTMDAGTGQLTPQGEVPVAGGPSPLTMSPDRQVLYVGHRTVPGISSLRIDPDTGGLTQSGTVAPEAAPTFLSTDRTGRYVLSAYYQGAHAAVHPVGDGPTGFVPGQQRYRCSHAPGDVSRGQEAHVGPDDASWRLVSDTLLGDQSLRLPLGPRSGTPGERPLNMQDFQQKKGGKVGWDDLSIPTIPRLQQEPVGHVRGGNIGIEMRMGVHDAAAGGAAQHVP